MTDLFVSLTGSDKANGTIDFPLKSLQAACDRALPGTTIYLREGLYQNSERLQSWTGRKKGMKLFGNFYPNVDKHPGTSI